MGSTPRDRLTQLPMPTRSTEASAECFGRTVLSYFREDEQKPASFFILGDVLHRTIEGAIVEDLDYLQALDMANILLEQELVKATPLDDVIESSQRGLDTIEGDIMRMLMQWFNTVHPDGEKRHPIYDEYQWPPRVETEFHRTARSAGTKYAVWGSIDALFDHKRIGEVHFPFLIIDWKSGTQKQKSDFQLNFYRFGMNLPEARAGFHHLDRKQERAIIQLAEAYPGDDEIREAIELTERRKDAVVAGRMPRFVPSFLCGYCPVQHLCPVDGDPRNHADNRAALEELLKSVEPMTEIPSQVQGGIDIGRVQ